VLSRIGRSGVFMTHGYPHRSSTTSTGYTMFCPTPRDPPAVADPLTPVSPDLTQRRTASIRGPLQFSRHSRSIDDQESIAVLWSTPLRQSQVDGTGRWHC